MASGTQAWVQIPAPPYTTTQSFISITWEQKGLTTKNTGEERAQGSVWIKCSVSGNRCVLSLAGRSHPLPPRHSSSETWKGWQSCPKWPKAPHILSLLQRLLSGLFSVFTRNLIKGTKQSQTNIRMTADPEGDGTKY